MSLSFLRMRAKTNRSLQKIRNILYLQFVNTNGAEVISLASLTDRERELAQITQFLSDIPS
jgi:hypothetical protein